MVTAGKQGVRCPHCNKKIGDRLNGTLHLVCPRCKRELMLSSDRQRVDIREIGF